MLYRSSETRPAAIAKLKANKHIRKGFSANLSKHIREASLGLPTERSVTEDRRPLFKRRLDELEEEFDAFGDQMDPNLFDGASTWIKANNLFAQRLIKLITEARHTLTKSGSPEYVRIVYESLENSPLFFHLFPDQGVKAAFLQFDELAHEIGMASPEVTDAEEEEMYPIVELDDERRDEDGDSPVKV